MTGMIEKMKSWVSLLPPIGYTNILEIVILAVLVYEILLWIKNTRDDASATTINEIIRATFEMAKKKTGALIVIQQNQPLKEIEETGIRINGIVSSALLINIFEKNTPLHDGAVTIVGDKVTAATCYLPLSDTDISKDFGTRHRAALGMSEMSDAVTIVVSEETGRVSVAANGKLRRAQDAEALRSMLPTREQKEMDKNTRFRIFRTTRKEGKA